MGKRQQNEADRRAGRWPSNLFSMRRRVSKLGFTSGAGISVRGAAGAGPLTIDPFCLMRRVMAARGSLSIAAARRSERSFTTMSLSFTSYKIVTGDAPGGANARARRSSRPGRRRRHRYCAAHGAAPTFRGPAGPRGGVRGIDRTASAFGGSSRRRRPPAAQAYTAGSSRFRQAVMRLKGLRAEEGAAGALRPHVASYQSLPRCAYTATARTAAAAACGPAAAQ